MRRPLGWPHVVLLSIAVVSLLTVADAGGALRLGVTLWFLLVCPGMAFAPLLPRVSGPARLGLAIALALAIDTAVATTLLALGSFSADGGLLALAIICAAGCAWQVVWWERRAATRIRVRAASPV